MVGAIMQVKLQGDIMINAMISHVVCQSIQPSACVGR